MAVEVAKDTFVPSKPWVVRIEFPDGSKATDGPFKTKGAANESAALHRSLIDAGVSGIVVDVI